MLVKSSLSVTGSKLILDYLSRLFTSLKSPNRLLKSMAEEQKCVIAQFQGIFDPVH